MEINGLFSEWEDDHNEYDEPGCVSYPVTITTEHAASSYGQPVVVVDGEARGVADMPPGELQVPPEHLATVRAAGYEAQSLADNERESYWRKARPVGGHWHPEARLVQY